MSDTTQMGGKAQSENSESLEIAKQLEQRAEGASETRTTAANETGTTAASETRTGAASETRTGAASETETRAASKTGTASETVAAAKPSKRGLFPTWGDLLAILGLFLLSQLITRFIFIALGMEIPSMGDIASLTGGERRALEFDMGYSLFIWSIIAQPMVLAFVLIYRQVRGGVWGRVRYSMRGFDPTILLWGVVMLFSLVIVIEPLMEILPETAAPSGRGVYMLFALLGVAPVFEELLCRGVIFEAVRAKRGAWAACVLSSMIFGLMHFEPQFVLNAFIVGLLLSYIYLRTRSIFAPIILHSLNNLFAYLFLILGVADMSLSDFVGSGVVYMVIYGVAAVVLLFSLISITRYVNKLGS